MIKKEYQLSTLETHYTSLESGGYKTTAFLRTNDNQAILINDGHVPDFSAGKICPLLEHPAIIYLSDEQKNKLKDQQTSQEIVLLMLIFDAKLELESYKRLERLQNAKAEVQEDDAYLAEKLKKLKTTESAFGPFEKLDPFAKTPKNKK